MQQPGVPGRAVRAGVVFTAAVLAIGSIALAGEGDALPPGVGSRITSRPARDTRKDAPVKTISGGAARSSAPQVGGDGPVRRPGFANAASGGVSLDAAGVRLEIGPGGEASVALVSEPQLGARIETLRLSRGDAVEQLKGPSPCVLDGGARATIAHGETVVEAYEQRPNGVEQLFVLPTEPAGDGAVALELRMGGALEATQPGPNDAITLRDPLGRARLTYGIPVAFDVTGDSIECGLEVLPASGGLVRITIPEEWASRAKWPVVIDPLIGTSEPVSVTNQQERRGDIAYSQAGDQFMMVWEHTIGAGRVDILARRFAVAASPTGLTAIDTIAVTVTNTGNNASPVVAYLGGGGFDRYLICWIDVTNDRILGAIVNATATANAAITPLPNVFDQSPFDMGGITSGRYRNIEALSLGGSTVGDGWLLAIEARYFETGPNFDTDVATQLISPVGTTFTPLATHALFSTVSPAHGDDHSPRVNRLSNGTVGWSIASEFDLTATDSDPIFGFVDPFGTPILFNVARGNPPQNVLTNALFLTDIGIAASGIDQTLPCFEGTDPEWLLSWATAATTSANIDIVGVRWTAVGLNFGVGALTAITANASVNERLHVTAGLPGEWLVAWNVPNASGVSGTARYARYSLDLSTLRETAVAFGQPDRMADLAVAARLLAGPPTSSSYTLLWSEFNTSSSEFDLRAQRMEENLNPVMHVHEVFGGGRLLTNDELPAAGARNFFRRDPANGASTPITFVVENTAGQPLVLSNLQSSIADFVVTASASFANPVTAGASTTFTVSFSPQSAGTKDGEITFTFAGGGLTPSTFTLNVTGEGVASAFTATSTTLTAIPDPGTVASTIFFPQSGVVAAIRVTNVTIDHPFVSDLTFTLIAPNGTSFVVLADGVGGGNEDFLGTTFASGVGATPIAAGTPPFYGIFAPEGDLRLMEGLSAQGNWTLEIADNFAIDEGNLHSWSLEIVLATGPGLRVSEGGAILASGDPVGGGRDFGTQPTTGTPASVTITLESTGISALDVTSGPTSSTTDFTVVTGTALTGIAPGASRTFQIQFTPQSAGVKNAVISFNNNAAGQSPFAINVTGIAFDPATARTFTLPATSGLPLLVPDDDPFGVDSVIQCPGGGTVLAVSLTAVTLRHAYVGDFSVILTSPTGTSIEILLTDAFGDGDDVVDASFDDSAAAPLDAGSGTGPFTGSFLPFSGSFSDFAGEQANGAWTLNVSDNVAELEGLLESWTLVITTSQGLNSTTPYLVVRRGSASGPVVPSSPSRDFVIDFDFSQLNPSAPPPTTFFVQNAGGGTLNVQQPTVPGAFTNDFDVTGGPFPTLGFGQSGSFSVAFSPATSGVRATTLTASFTGGGALASPYSIALRGVGVGGTEVVNATTGLPAAIPDDDPVGVSVSATAVNAGTIAGVTAAVDITHTFDGDLTIQLTHQGVTVVLADQIGDAGEDYLGTVFSDGATLPIERSGTPYTGRFRPQDSPGLDAFIGLPAAGVWTLTVIDNAAGDIGTVDAFSLEIGTDAPPATPKLEVRRGSAVGTTMTSDETATAPFAFGDRKTNTGAASAVVFIKNVGTAVLDLSGLQISGDTGYTLSPASFPGSGNTQQLQAGQSTTVTIIFTPSAAPLDTPSSATMQFANTDPDTTQSPFKVKVTGTAKRPTTILGSSGGGGGGGGCSAGGAADTSTPALLAAALALYAASRVRRGGVGV